MSDVVIAGVGQTPVGEHWELSMRSQAYRAIRDAIADAGGLEPQAMYIGNALGATLSHQANLGALLTEQAGLEGIEGTTIEAAGASGAQALRQGYLAVASGLVETAVVVGVEKMTDMIGSDVDAALAQMTDADWEAVQGVTPTTQAALLMQLYMHAYQVPHEAFSCFPIIAHANGAGNPNAMYRKAIRPEAYTRADMVCDPLNLMDVAPYGDGAAAIVLTSASRMKKNGSRPVVRISGSASVIDTLALHDRPEPLAWLAAGFSVERACRQAGILPTDVDLFEYYDAYSIYAALSLEAAGFAKHGEGWKLAQDGVLDRNGRLPAATMGGLKARGNPVGATGVYQAVEAVMQLRGEAGACQVPGARRALVQSLGGPASTAVTHVLERM